MSKSSISSPSGVFTLNSNGVLSELSVLVELSTELELVELEELLELLDELPELSELSVSLLHPQSESASIPASIKTSDFFIKIPSLMLSKNIAKSDRFYCITK